MGKIKSIKFNFIMNFILTASNFIFPLITFPYVSRVLLASGNGKIAFVSSVANYFGMVASLGVPTYGIRVCAQVRDDKEKLSKTTQELIFIHAIMTFIVLVFFFISVMTIGKFYQEKELMFINGISLLLNVLGVNWLYSALEQYQYITVRSILFKIISVILMFALVHQKSDYIIYGAVTVFAAAGSNVFNFIHLHKHVKLKKHKNYNLKQHIKPIVVFFAQSVAITVYTNLDNVMLGFLKNDTQVGLYTAAMKIKTILVSLVTSLGTVLMPRLSYYINQKKHDEFMRLIKNSVTIVLILSLSLSSFFIIMAKPSILFLSGEGYLDAVLAMQIIIPSIIFIGLSNITGLQILTPLGKENIVLLSVIVGAIVDLVLNYIFIPFMGSAGASIGTLVAEIAVLIVQLYYIKTMKIKIFDKKNTIKLLLALFLSFFVLIIFIKSTNLTNLKQLLLGGCIFFGLEIIVLVLEKESFLCNQLRIIKSKLMHR